MKSEKEKQELRHLVKWQKDLSGYVSGQQSTFVPPFTADASKKFVRLGRKYKYDPEFADEGPIMNLSSSGTAHTRSKNPRYR